METAAVKTALGTIRISDEVIAEAAREATLTVPGIHSMDDRFSHGLSAVIGDEDAEGVRVDIKGKEIIIDLYVAVQHGGRIPAIALKLQEVVRDHISQTLGLTVNAVNVNVQRIVFTENEE